MLHKATDITGDTVAAIDGAIGRITDLYFDDETWGVRYLVVDTGGWLNGRTVLIAPAAVDAARSTETAIAVNLTRDQVRNSPGVETDKPVSRQYEEIYARYYGYPFYWADPVGLPPLAPASTDDADEVAAAEARAAQSHLRSSSEVIGNTVEARDGPLGHVDDLMVDDGGWSVADLVVDTRNWIPGRKVLVPPGRVSRIDWKNGEVAVLMGREEILSQPAVQ
jgi:uncharacterized protein YrrD